MTTPTPPPIVTTVEPSKAKSWVALVGSLITMLTPLLISAKDYLPAPWPAVVGAVLAVGTWLTVRQTSNHPANTSLVPNDQIITLPQGTGYTPVPDAPTAPASRPVQQSTHAVYRNPYPFLSR